MRKKGGLEMGDIEKAIKGIECCLRRDELNCIENCPYYTVEGHNAHGCWIPLNHDALALLKAYKQRKALEVHNISNVDIPYGVTEAQFHAVMYNVVTALEHTDRGESWPYDDERGGVE